jgi:hypothetical protein
MDKEYFKKYYQENKEKLKKRQLKYHHANKDVLNEKQKVRSRKHYLNNKLKKKKYQKQYLKNNPKYMVNYVKNRIKVDPEFRLMKVLRSRFSQIFKNKKKFTSVINLIGCSLNEFKSHLESQFKPEMTWANHGTVWEIDHIKPISSFDLIKLEEQIKCCNYTNLQPLFKTTKIAESFGYLSEIGNRNKKKI